MLEKKIIPIITIEVTLSINPHILNIRLLCNIENTYNERLPKVLLKVSLSIGKLQSACATSPWQVGSC